MAVELIAVTGANGFLGVHIVDQLLRAKVHTRAIVRSESSADQLRKLYKDEIDNGLLVFAFVPDIATRGPVYDQAFKGITGLIHTASPVFQNPTNSSPNIEEKFLKPAINGALNAVEAAHRTSSVKKVVLTASVVSAGPILTVGPIDHDFYDPITYEEAKSLPDDQKAYGASKTLAEKAVWQFYKANNPSYTLTTLNAGLIIGSNLTGKSVDTGSNGLALLLLKAPQAVSSFPTITVQDAAAAHINALRGSQTDGKRLILVEKIFFAKDAIALAKKYVHSFPIGTDEEISYPEEGTYRTVKQPEDLEVLELKPGNRTEDAFVKLLREIEDAH